jgi:hypothetical protein
MSRFITIKRLFFDRQNHSFFNISRISFMKYWLFNQEILKSDLFQIDLLIPNSNPLSSARPRIRPMALYPG